MSKNKMVLKCATFFGLRFCYRSDCGFNRAFSMRFVLCYHVMISIAHSLYEYHMRVYKSDKQLVVNDLRRWFIRFRACHQFYYNGRKPLILCVPLLTYNNICCAAVLENQ